MNHLSVQNAARVVGTAEERTLRGYITMETQVVARLLEQTARAVYDARGPRAVHPGQWAVMRYLSLAGVKGRTVSGIADYLGVTHAPASRAVAALARKKLVSVKASSADKRVRQIDLTESGKTLLKKDPVNRLAEAIGELDAKKQKDFAKSLETIYERLASS